MASQMSSIKYSRKNWYTFYINSFKKYFPTHCFGQDNSDTKTRLLNFTSKRNYKSTSLENIKAKQSTCHYNGTEKFTIKRSIYLVSQFKQMHWIWAPKTLIRLEGVRKEHPDKRNTKWTPLGTGRMNRVPGRLEGEAALPSGWRVVPGARRLWLESQVCLRGTNFQWPVQVI